MSALSAGRKHMTDAAAALKTSLFKWSPDWISAAHSYEKAAVSFKAAGELDLCVDAFNKAAEAHLKSNNDLSAAKCWENIGDIDMNRSKDAARLSIEDTVKYAEHAANCLGRAQGVYRVGGETTKAASCLSNKARALAAAAESLPESNPKRSQLLDAALEDFLLSCEILESSGRVAFSVDTFRHTLNFVVKMKRWQDSLKVIDKMIPVFLQLKQKSATHKARLSKVVILLEMNDAVAARNAFREGFDDAEYLRSDECAAAEDLLNAWEKMDEEGVKQVLSRQVFAYLERQIAIVAHELSPLASFDEYDALADQAEQAAIETEPLTPPAPAPVVSSTVPDPEQQPPTPTPTPVVASTAAPEQPTSSSELDDLEDRLESNPSTTVEPSFVASQDDSTSAEQPEQPGQPKEDVQALADDLDDLELLR